MKRPPFIPPEVRLQHPIPADTERAVRERARNCCEDCGCAGPLEMHHLRYRRYVELRHVPDRVSLLGREEPEDLDLLCRACHRNRHLDLNGEWWNDPEEMAEHWGPYYDALERIDWT